MLINVSFSNAFSEAATSTNRGSCYVEQNIINLHFCTFHLFMNGRYNVYDII